MQDCVISVSGYIRGGTLYLEDAVSGESSGLYWHLPYRWQASNSGCVTWKDLPDMESIEKAYCDPRRDTSCMYQQSQTLRSVIFQIFRRYFLRFGCLKEHSVDFKTMTCEGFPVRRLSTPSSVTEHPHAILTTQWLWYWKNDNGDWKEFGQGNTPASITSQSLENVYLTLADNEREIDFTAGRHEYLLYIEGAPGAHQMYQQNIEYKTKREVRRRPRFVSSQDVELRLKSLSSQGSNTFPPHWDKNALPDLGYKLVGLPRSEEHNNIEKMFKCTMPTRPIVSIQRIQNPSLWRSFQLQREQMKKRNGGKAVNEQYLFHGTDESGNEAICDQNFDWRLCGVHGTAYGKGSYFARDASYSDVYVKAKKSLTKTMFLALVLVGEYTQGKSTYVRPPPKGDGKTFYDSCVDNESNPSIYVVFEKQQIYPEYLITYS